MKLMICPICGGREVGTAFTVNNTSTPRNVRVETPYMWCYLCEHEVIPLATPQDDGVFRTTITNMYGEEVPVVAYKS